jgi:decaprenylphospho-beta-D-ribofuranose 2-oxidase
MSVAEQSRGALLRGTERTLAGWGRTSPCRARVVAPRSGEEVAEILAESPPGGLIARGAGCSYGDAAQRRNGTVLDMTGLARILSIDAERRLISAEAGATIAQLLARLAPHGLTLPVLPGTRHVTLAGAIASDIHGKNHHLDGAFARHVTEIQLCRPSGEVVSLRADSDAELFYATLGGMGLTGVILAATLAADTLPHPWLLEDLDRTSGLEETLELLGTAEPRRYSVAWLDMLAPGARMGRAVLSSADPMPADHTPPAPRRGPAGAGAVYPDCLLRRAPLRIRRIGGRGVLGTQAVRAFNTAYWSASPRRRRAHPVPCAPYFFPLDVVEGWNRLYGRDGFRQYQLVIPAGAEADLRRCFEVMRALPVYLAVFKRFGSEFGGPLSFPLEGWTLAADLPAGAPGVSAGLDRLDEILAGCGGRVYLTKDSRMRREHLGTMYPRLQSFMELRGRVDPEGLMRSDLGARLGLSEAFS